MLVGSVVVVVDEVVVVVGDVVVGVTTGGGSSVVTVVVVPSGRVMVVMRVGFFVVVVVEVAVSEVDDEVGSTEGVDADVGTRLSASRTASLRGGWVAGVSEALPAPAASEATAAKMVARTTPDTARMI